ncbi:MAG: 4-hydroxy-tetrahydrodipicolinate reductase [Sutterella wadsworthensis]
MLVGMGRIEPPIRDCAADRGIEVAAEFNTATIAQLAQCDRMDAVIDFSAPASLPALAAYVQRTGTPLVSAPPERRRSCPSMRWAATRPCGERQLLHRRCVLKHLAAEAAALLPDFDIEIIETHHRMKKDAPSGTAKLLLSAVNPDGTHPTVFGREGFAPRTAGEIGVHAVRGGTVAGVHTVSFFGDEEELSLTHRAESRRIFAIGALKTAEKLKDAPVGLHTLDELLFARR